MILGKVLFAVKQKYKFMWYRISKNNLNITYRPLREDDYASLFRIYNNKNVVKNTNWEGVDVTADLMKQFTNQCIEHPTRKSYSVCDNGNVIGVVFLHNLEKHPDWAEVGCMLSENYWNKGIMTNVIKDVIDKSDHNKFYSITTHTNNGSMKLFKKLGFNEDPSFIDEPDTISFSFIKTI